MTTNIINGSGDLDAPKTGTRNLSGNFGVPNSMPDG